MKYVRIIDTPGVMGNSIQAMESYNSLKEKILGSSYGEGGSLEYGLERYLDYQTETIVYNLINKFSEHKYLLSKNYLKSFDIISADLFIGPIHRPTSASLRPLRVHFSANNS